VMISWIRENQGLFRFFSKDCYGRWASYRCAERLVWSSHKKEGTRDTTLVNSRHSGGISSHSDGDSSLSERFDPFVLKTDENARTKNRMRPEARRDLLGVLAPRNRAESSAAPPGGAVVTLPDDDDNATAHGQSPVSCYAFQGLLRTIQITCSMFRTGCYYGNAGIALFSGR
jgi:hypothetical protein